MADATTLHEEYTDEKTPLLQNADGPNRNSSRTQVKAPLHRRVIGAILGTCRVIGSAFLAPGRYVVACFYDEDGNFSLAMPIYRIGRKLSRRQKRPEAQAVPSQAVGNNQANDNGQERRNRGKTSKTLRQETGIRLPLAMTDSGYDTEKTQLLDNGEDTPSQRTRSKTGANVGSGTDESDQGSVKKVNKIKILNQDALRHRRPKKEQLSPSGNGSYEPTLTVHTIKSPTSPLSNLKLTKYPRAPTPPRPLIPRRQPSYSPSSGEFASQKTLIIDLDETLIHSMAKGGRMSTGHMVEVKLQTALGAGGAIIGPQVPILYYVHKRPHCDEFLRKVCNYKLQRGLC